MATSFVKVVWSYNRYLRRYRDPHRSLAALGAACRQVGGIKLVRVPMHPLALGTSGLTSLAGSFLGKLFGHLLLVPKAYDSNSKVLLIREFLTLPLLFIAPAIWPRRKALWFICHHNVGFAAGNAIHRSVLSLLSWSGFRFVVGESLDGWWPVNSTPNRTRVMAMPWPMPEINRRSPAREPGLQTTVVGFVGNFRAERSPLWALDEISRAIGAGRFSSPLRLLVGTADAEFTKNWADRAMVMDTTSRADYLHALECCDVIVLPYDEAAYMYRTSGVLAEAVALGCIVVTPNLPVLRDQVMRPVPVGACYATRTGLVDAVAEAIGLANQPARNSAIAAHKAYRSLEAIKQVIRQLTTA